MEDLETIFLAIIAILVVTGLFKMVVKRLK